MSHYPVILIPAQIQGIKSKLPPVEVFNEPQPQLTAEEPKKVNNTLIAVEAAAVCYTEYGDRESGSNLTRIDTIPNGGRSDRDSGMATN